MNNNIRCNVEELIINKDREGHSNYEERTYTNRPINLDKCIQVGKATGHMPLKNIVNPKSDSINVELPTIKFTITRTHNLEWFFETKEDRDNCYEDIIVSFKEV